MFNVLCLRDSVSSFDMPWVGLVCSAYYGSTCSISGEIFFWGGGVEGEFPPPILCLLKTSFALKYYHHPTNADNIQEWTYLGGPDVH